MNGRTGVRAVASAAVSVLAAACSSGGGHHASPPTRPPRVVRSTPTPSAQTSRSTSHPATCPASYAAPDPARPRIALHFRLSDDLATVTGTEDVTFVPDRPVTELVFRLTANEPPLEGGTPTGGLPSTRVTAVVVAGRAVRARFEPAGAQPTTQGGLVRVPLRRQTAPGTTITARLDFTLQLGGEGFDRFGHTATTAWWGSGQPLLAWERGVGWHTEPMTDVAGETATSEAADTTVTVDAPADLAVVGTGTYTASTAVGGRRTWSARSGTARDVAVFAASGLTTVTKRVGATRVTVVASSRPEAAGALGLAERALNGLARALGPFPYPSLTIPVVPSFGGGIEYPGVTLIGLPNQSVVSHEIAHQYFYGMVGNSQARDPWLDEAFATYESDGAPPGALWTTGDVGAPMSYWQRHPGYDRVVYEKGAAMLAAARKAAGGRAFDAALRCYVRAEAWKIARPKDLATAFRRLPAALHVLRTAGAIR